MYSGSYGARYSSAPFDENYRCYSASSIEKPHLENGDKVLMPASALERLASLQIDYPMLFEVRNPSTAFRTRHCGVLEFTAEEGVIYMPGWLMRNMLLHDGDMVRVKSATLPKGTFVKLRPHTKDFLDVSNPRAMLETTLRNFSCLTVGATIMVAYNDKKYYVDIIESKPADAISIIETDCEVDFAPPLDYREPERVPVVAAAPSTPPEPEETKFNAFTGTGRRLDGRPSTGTVIPTTTAPSATTTSSAQGRPPGKLVFGGAGGDRKDEAKEEKKEAEGPKFQAFTGRKYSLRD